MYLLERETVLLFSHKHNRTLRFSEFQWNYKNVRNIILTKKQGFYVENLW